LGIKLGVAFAFILIQVGVDVDEVDVFEPLLGGGFQRDQAADGLGVDQQFVLWGIGHVGQIQAGDEVGAVEMVAGRDLLEGTGDIAEVEIGLGVAAKTQSL
jgi:hypothetical protein